MKIDLSKRPQRLLTCSSRSLLEISSPSGSCIEEVAALWPESGSPLAPAPPPPPPAPLTLLEQLEVEVASPEWPTPLELWLPT